jgi:hypothetical protein
MDISMRRVNSIWYPNTEYWNKIAEYAARMKHRAFLSERNKLNGRYKSTGGKPPIVKLKFSYLKED